MEQQYYRTFIALPVRATMELLQLTEGLRRSLPDEHISWVRPENYHFTLRFLGATPADQVAIIGEALKSGIHSGAFTLRLTGPGSFGPRKRPKVLFIGVAPSPELEKVYVQVEQIIKECGWPPADRPFRAHLTLGRVRRLNNVAALEDALRQFSGAARGTHLMDRLVYFRSVPGPSGPVYSALKEVLFD